MSLPSASTSALVEPTKKKKKPACDACKARRVLCHRQPEGIPCPRCAEKGIICKTSTVQRGRPRKADELPSPPTTPEQAQLQPLASSSCCNCSPIAVRARVEVSNPLDPSPELVKHLFDCLLHFPQSRHLFFRSEALKTALHSASYQLNLLPPQPRVLATCICALSATVSFHPAIIGPSTITSFTDPATFFAGADLRAYGVRRAPMYRALYERAFALACEARIQVDVSADNAASCFLLDVLERINAAPSRPWAVSFVSHARMLAGKGQPKLLPGQWNGFNDVMFGEALAAVARRTPVLFTYNDQLLLTGSEPPALEQLLQSLKAISHKKVALLALPAVWPCMFHVTRLARELYDNISGDYARRHPLAEGAVIHFLASLSILQSILSLVLTHPDLSSADGDVLFYDFPAQNPMQRREVDNVRVCVFVMSIGFTSLVIALRKEIAYRVRQADEATTSVVVAETTSRTQSQTRWAHERLRTIERQVREMAGQAVGDVARTLQLLPSLPHLAHLEWSCIQDWADFCIAEAAESGGVDSARARVMGTFISALKLFGYSCEIQRSGELIAQMEAFVGQHRASDDYSEFNFSIGLNSGGNDANSAVTVASAFNAESFALDNSWAGMLDFDFGQYDGGSV